ncbi:MAG: RNA methyltransferase [Prevotella sp.]|nr:RNA methyltransferase [Prevotella sp.]
MISKNLIKLIKSLEQKKYRRREQLYVAEGPKVVHDLMAIHEPQRIVATEKWFSLNNIAPDVVVTENELRKVSFLQHPQEVLALFPLPKPNDVIPQGLEHQLSLALDDVQDPGNLGTIIRIADWFAIEHIFCSNATADAYNPKVIQSTMGSIARVNIHYMELTDLFKQLDGRVPIYGTFLDGTSLYEQTNISQGIIVMGNEGNGISPETAAYVNRRLLIPSFPEGRPTAESLNVAVATAITCAEFRRRQQISK